MLVENSLYIDIQSYSILRKVNERIFALVINKGMGFITTIVEVDEKTLYCVDKQCVML